MTFIKSFLTGGLYDCFKPKYAYLNEGDNIRECYSCLKMMIQAHLHVRFITVLLIIKRASLKQFYLYMKLLQSSTIFKQKNNYEVSCDQNFYMKYFTTPNLKNIIATLRMVIIEKSDIPSYIIFPQA